MMRRHRIRVSAAGMVMALLVMPGCGLFNDEDTSPPPVPIMIEHGPDAAVSEVGIDAVSSADHIQVYWLAVTADDLDGYLLYRYRYYSNIFVQDSSGADTLIADIASSGNAGDTLFITDAGVQENVRYYYYARSYDENGNRSDRSSAVDYMLTAKVSISQLEAPKGDVPRSGLRFKVKPLYISSVTQIIIKVYDVNIGKIIWASAPVNAFNTTILPYNADSSAIRGLEGERQYRWRVDAVGSEANSGSESHWCEFFLLD